MLIERREIREFPGYRIGNDGIAQSCLVHNGPYPRKPGDAWFDLNPRRNSTTGYLSACLYIDGKPHYRRIHRLVLEAFVGPCPAGMECLHSDGNPGNNRLDNLRWGTPEENASDRVRHGTSNRGERHGLAKLTTDDVVEIRRLRAKGISSRLMAEQFGVHKETIARVVSGRGWTHV